MVHPSDHLLIMAGMARQRRLAGWAFLLAW